MFRYRKLKTTPFISGFLLRNTIIISVFLCAYFAYYFISQQQIEKQYTKYSEEYFNNIYQQIEKAISQAKNDIYLMKNDPAIRNFSNKNSEDASLDNYIMIEDFKKLKTYNKYIDDVILYNPSGKRLLTSDGSIDGDLYFKSVYIDGKQFKDWSDVFSSGSRETYSIDTRYVSVGYESESGFSSELLYIDRSFAKSTGTYLGVVLDLAGIVNDSSNTDKLSGHVFIVASSSDPILLGGKYKIDVSGDSEAYTSGRVNVGKNKDQLIFYKYDKTRDWVFANVINKKDMDEAMGTYTQSLKMILVFLVAVGILLTLFIYLNTLREFSGLTEYIEKSFISNLSSSDFSKQWINSIRKFIGLNRIRKAVVIMAERRIPAVLDKESFLKLELSGKNIGDDYLVNLLTNTGVRYKSFIYAPLKKIYILDAEGDKTMENILEPLKKHLSSDKSSGFAANVTYYISGTYSTDDIAKAVKEVLLICDNSPVNPSGRVVLQNYTAENITIYFPDNLISIMSNYLSTQNAKGMTDTIYNTIEKNIAKGISKKSLKEVVSRINGILSDLVSEKLDDAKDIVLHRVSMLYESFDVLEIGSLADCYSFLIDGIMKCCTAEDSGKSRLKELFVKYIEENYTKDICLETMAEHFNFTSKYTSAKFKELIGENFSEYLKKHRILLGKNLLKNPQYKINDVSELVGYTNVNNFIRHFKSLEGITPSIYRNLHFE